jgi:flagellar hook-basal body complex protein FliE
MTMAIDKLAGFGTPLPTTRMPIGATADAGAGFGDTLNRLVQAVETTGTQANSAVSQMIEGKADVHDAMIALQRADLTFQLSMQIRNKLVQAYQEIMRMPV